MLVLWSVGVSSSPAAAAPKETPSGLPVPRWVSLKSGEINARNGPGEDHRILWTYRAKGLPVQVLAETRDWRRVCDPQGGLAWVNVGTTSGRRMVMRLKPQALPLLKKPAAGAPPAAYLAPRGLAALDRCKDGWCRIKAGGSDGWAPAAQLWGTEERPQCSPRRR
jgi:SH3-like domain-containing protein